MFYVEKNNESKERESIWLRIVPSLIVFIFFFSLTIWAALDANRRMNNDQYYAVSQKVDKTKLRIQSYMSTYEGILRAGVGHVAGSPYIDDASWAKFVSSIGTETRYPGIQGIGFAKIIKGSEADAHNIKMRSEGKASFTVHPTAPTPDTTQVIIDYLDPDNEKNKKALGFDMYSNPTRRVAMDTARDTGQAALSDIITLVQDQNSTTPQPGFLMYLPLYKGGVVPRTVEERRANIQGFVYAPFRAYDLLDNLLDENTSSYGFQIRNDNTKDTKVVYESPSYETVNKSLGKYVDTQYLQLYNREMMISGVSDSSDIPLNERTRAMNTFWSGLVLSLLVAGFIYLLLFSRGRVLAQRKETELQSAKDELLALASHQLRTPATGVKQYIDMLRDGFGGELNKHQMAFADKAYQSNERQLRTINEMLCVARMDAGKIQLTKQRFNLNSVIEMIVDEHVHTIKQRQQRLHVNIPYKPTYINADERYIRMAVENLLSNASKYTPEGGTITIKVTSGDNMATVSVSDNGVGVTPKDQSMLFKKFSRIPNELTNKVSGTGIGLYLVQQIAVSHGGSVTYSPTKPKGSTFRLMVPLDKATKNHKTIERSK